MAARTSMPTSARVPSLPLASRTSAIRTSTSSATCSLPSHGPSSGEQRPTACGCARHPPTQPPRLCLPPRLRSARVRPKHRHHHEQFPRLEAGHSIPSSPPSRAATAAGAPAHAAPATPPASPRPRSTPSGPSRSLFSVHSYSSSSNCSTATTVRLPHCALDASRKTGRRTSTSTSTTARRPRFRRASTPHPSFVRARAPPPPCIHLGAPASSSPSTAARITPSTASRARTSTTGTFTSTTSGATGISPCTAVRLSLSRDGPASKLETPAASTAGFTARPDPKRPCGASSAGHRRPQKRR
ncbi:hypothetical protein B0H16DRAFT_1529892 [Mycena metata]|uniref:Uncharacterized protein n=1 Tax=Mycena metata TaxID=1033252 RepID=A0AAD7NIQ8_9AGAR|nr:hypothetical protein B0H16DRAFT_1529892 [Mycena metata]